MEHRWKVLIIVSVAVFMASLDLFIVNVAFPDIAADFDGAAVADLSWVLNAYAIVFAALLVPAGRLADRVGRRRAFLGGLGVFLLGSTLCGVAPSVETLVAARVLQAAGAALLMPTSLALLLPEFPPAKRAAAIGVWAAVGGVAAAFGPPLGGLLVEASWRLVFLVNVPFGIAAALYGAKVLRESRDETARPADAVGTVLLIASVALLALGVVKAPEWGWGDARTGAALAGAVVGLAAFVVRCGRHPSPVLDLGMLRVRSFALANAAALLFSVAFAAMLLGNVLFLTGVWGDSVLKAGLSLAPGPMMAAATAVPAGRLAGRVGQARLAGAGCLVFGAAAVWWTLRMGATPDYAGAMLPGQIVSGIGVGLALPSFSSAAAASLPPTRFATGSAVVTMSRQIGTVLGVAILVAVLGTPAAGDGVGAYDDGWTFIAVAAALGAAAAFGIGEVRQHVAPAAAAVVAPAGAAVAAEVAA